MLQQTELFDFQQNLPNGLIYRPDFLTSEDEATLLTFIHTLPFREARFQQYTAKRRVVRFCTADYLNEGKEEKEEKDFPHLEFPPLLCGLRGKIAAWLNIANSRFVHGIITEYRPGTPIGWHCDAPHFDIVVGISLASPCHMLFRPSATRDAKHRVGIALQPRSAYVMSGEIRCLWQHSIAATKAVRYSITLRTLVS